MKAFGAVWLRERHPTPFAFAQAMAITTRSRSRTRKRTLSNASATVDRRPATRAARDNDRAEDDGSPKESSSGGKSYFLFKSEGESRIVDGHDYKFSIDDLANEKEQTSCWDGVRNYQARNIMREMKTGDQGFFYHSNCKNVGIVGLVTVVREAYPDHTQFDQSSKYYDAKSKPTDPRWFMVDVRLDRRTARTLSLQELKQYKDSDLKEMHLLNTSRLSVQRVSPEEWSFILGLEDHPPPESADGKPERRKAKR